MRTKSPIPPLYHVVKYHGDIAGLEEVFKDHQDFVVKPARGSGGSGIFLLQVIGDRILSTE